jgi:hypothetical protein
VIDFDFCFIITFKADRYDRELLGSDETAANSFKLVVASAPPVKDLREHHGLPLKDHR